MLNGFCIRTSPKLAEPHSDVLSKKFGSGWNVPFAKGVKESESKNDRLTNRWETVQILVNVQKHPNRSLWIFGNCFLGSDSTKSTVSSPKMIDFCFGTWTRTARYVICKRIEHMSCRYIYICIYMYICNKYTYICMYLYANMFTYTFPHVHMQYIQILTHIFISIYPLHTIWAIVDDAFTTPLLHFSCQVVESICGTRQRIKFFLWSRQGFGWFLSSWTNLGGKESLGWDLRYNSSKQWKFCFVQ